MASLSSRKNFSDRPTGAILSRQVLIRFRDVGDAHLGAVIKDLPSLPGTQRDDSEEHGLGELRGVLEWRAGLRLALDRLHPVHLVTPRDSGVGLRHKRGVLGERHRKEPWVGAVGVVHENSLLTNEDDTALALERDVVGEKIGTRRIQSAVVPTQLHRRLCSALRKL